jgi:hypothetical protein
MFTRTKSATPVKKKWEYREFVYQQWILDRDWVCLASNEGNTTPLALDFFWKTYQQSILSELWKWCDEGWEPLEEPGVHSLKLRWTEKVSPGIDPSDIILWITTFGIALLLQILARELPRRYVTYEPIEFRLQMRRLYPNSVA